MSNASRNSIVTNQTLFLLLLRPLEPIHTLVDEPPQDLHPNQLAHRQPARETRLRLLPQQLAHQIKGGQGRG